ncbi:ribosome-associated peptidylprolyl cis-trans isomerase, FKBP-type (trigger factor) [Syntrophotalea carbinolica DSM 2380]|uniref:Trigger factor n=1 Tax=Syntrophotalea carbinolica (strain DSM 2380 / NBRC 103641 / GraBd1) TaxID=338963 RepID=TIG_SYNC1|nr:trigger factor [Syntrophotalea carbinolica]Q3A3X4.1 RecName: Full=Trigger factor; Short=TF; AltName: Full=PPIase [Syntrophotalea carbinolica DSM 2380]ABA88933.1 ribosome-associated peptidylprolyl cis-trans isomerase, FKBP-type (trigger factor) [Syntrophotalea carbinolica DSM 2380]
MNVKVEDISSIKKKLSFEISVEAVDTEFSNEYKKLSKTAKIPGFRKGKVPRSVLERQYAGHVEGQVFERLVNETFFKALVDEKINAVSAPEVVDNGPLKPGQAFTYEAEVEVRPDVEAKDYIGLDLKKENFAVEDQDVEDRLQDMLKSRAKVEVSEREVAQAGDIAVIDFEGFVDGEAFAGGKAEGHELELGSNSFIPGFEDQVVGMECGQDKDIEVAFPEDYGNEELAGKPAVFKVRLNQIKERVLPALDEEFAKEAGLESVEDLKIKIRESIEGQERDRIEKDFRERMTDALIEANEFEVPEGMIDSQIDYMLKNLQNRMQAQGMRLEDMGINAESFRQIYREVAAKQVKASLILEAIALQENLKVEEDEIKDKLEEIVETSGAPKEAVMNYYSNDESRRGLVSQMAEEKVVAFLTGKAKIEMVDKEALENAKMTEE